MSDGKEGAANTGGGASPARFVGEEGEDTRSTPRKDLFAAFVFAAVSIAAMVLALRMPTMKSVMTAPGLLPFLVGLSLCAMAVGLGVRAVRNGATLRPGSLRAQPSPADSETETRLVPILIGLITAYVIAVDWVTFDLDIPTPLFTISVSSYELTSTIALAILLKVFWRATLLRCVLVSALWVIALAAAFRDVFHILLPGSA